MKRILFISLAFSALFSCTTKDSSLKNYSIFRYNESNGISSLDPAFARNIENISAVNQIYNGLVQMDSQLNVKPCIAKSWSVSDDRLTYAFHLRSDVKFHSHDLFDNPNERKVRAYDFVYSFQRLASEELASPGAWVLNFVARDAKGKLAVTAENDTTLIIQLTEPFPPFLGILTMQYCSVVPHEVVSAFGSDFRSNPIGTGPFKFKYWNESNKLVLLRNNDYFEKDEFGKSLPYLDAINVTFNKDEEVAFLKFLKGDLDYLSGLNGSYKDEILNSDGQLRSKYTERFAMITTPYLNTEYLGFNLSAKTMLDSTSPLVDERVRKAINYGFNRRKMMLYLRNGIGTPAEQGFIPQGLPGFNSNLLGYSYDTDTALALLASAGYSTANPLPPITLNTTAQYLDLCEFIQHELKGIGIELLIEVNPSGTHNEMVANGELVFFRKSWIADYPDAENYLALFYSKNKAPNGPNYTRFEDKVYDSLYSSSLSTIDDSLRIMYYMQMDEIIIENAVIIPLFYDQVVRFAPNYIEGLGINPMNLLSLKRTRKPKT